LHILLVSVLADIVSAGGARDEALCLL